MPQYPMPPWPSQPKQPASNRRRSRIGVDNPRFAHLPLVAPTADKTLQVLRGDPSLAQTRARKTREPELWEDPSDGPFYAPHPLFSFDEQVGLPHYVATNRFGRVRYVAADRLVWVGQLEFLLYTEPYEPSAAVAEAISLAELKAALVAEANRLEALEVEGWDLVRLDGGSQLLVDIRRPDEHLTKADLP